MTHPNPPSLERAAQDVIATFTRDGSPQYWRDEVCAHQRDRDALDELTLALAAHREQRKRIVEVLREVEWLGKDPDEEDPAWSGCPSCDAPECDGGGFRVRVHRKGCRLAALLSELEAEGSAEQ